MAAGPGPAPVSWEVVGQQAATDLDSNGQIVRGVNVTYRLASGFTRTVFVPEASYTLEQAKAIITADATNAGGIGGLTSEA